MFFMRPSSSSVGSSAHTSVLTACCPLFRVRRSKFLILDAQSNGVGAPPGLEAGSALDVGSLHLAMFADGPHSPLIHSPLLLSDLLLSELLLSELLHSELLLSELLHSPPRTRRHALAGCACYATLAAALTRRHLCRSTTRDSLRHSRCRGHSRCYSRSESARCSSRSPRRCSTTRLAAALPHASPLLLSPLPLSLLPRRHLRRSHAALSHMLRSRALDRRLPTQRAATRVATTTSSCRIRRRLTKANARFTTARWT